MRLVFLDASAPKPYCSQTLLSEPQGGTESTVTRIAEGLAAQGHAVAVGQLIRKEPAPFREGGAFYLPLDVAITTPRPDAVICLRSPRLVPVARGKFPDARHFLWLHDFNQNAIVADYSLLENTGVKIVCVSRTHKTAVLTELNGRIGPTRGLTLTFIYNPVADLEPDNTPVDRHKLVFFSSPHKGASHAVSLFNRLREFDPEFRLHIANPGYLPDSEHKDTGIVRLGQLPHGDVIKEVRSALCVFHPNWVFPETFGLVSAEAMSVGTPVLTTGLGANREVISNPEFTLMDRDPKAWIDRILKWRDERPVVKGREEFRLPNIIPQWERLLS